MVELIRPDLRKQAWVAASVRVELTRNSWYEPTINEAIKRTITTSRFDPLLVQSEIAQWNDLAREVSATVTGEFADRWPDFENTIRTYVKLNVYDWLMLPSRGPMEEFVRTSMSFQSKWGLARRLSNSAPRSETYDSRKGDVPRVTLRDVKGGRMVDFVHDWSHKGGFTAITAVTDSEGGLILLDVEARNKHLMPAGLLADAEALCRSWTELLAEYDYWVYQAGMNIGHSGIEPFPT